VIDDRLPMKWQQLFALLEHELRQASPTPMSQELQNFLRFLLQHRGEYERLARCGADLGYVAHVLHILVGFPTRHLKRAIQRLLPRKEDRQVLRETWQALLGIECLEDTIAHEGFTALSDELQTAIRSELSALRTLHDSLYACMATIYQKVEAADPLLMLLAQTRPIIRERGRPSAEIPTLFMVLLTDHLRDRTRRPCFREIGRVAYHLFEGSILDGVINDPKALREAVQDRCKKFRKTHDVAALRMAILSTETPFLEQT
jgi:hypothetical protein